MKYFSRTSFADEIGKTCSLSFCNDKIKRVIPKVRLVIFFLWFSLSPLQCDVLRTDGRTSWRESESRFVQVVI